MGTDFPESDPHDPRHPWFSASLMVKTECPGQTAQSGKVQQSRVKYRLRLHETFPDFPGLFETETYVTSWTTSA